MANKQQLLDARPSRVAGADVHVAIEKLRLREPLNVFEVFNPAALSEALSELYGDKVRLVDGEPTH